MKIPNLYKEQDILMFKKCYAMEKIHGTSAHVSYSPLRKSTTIDDGRYDDGIRFFSGGENPERFVGLWKGDNNLYDYEKLRNGLTCDGGIEITIYGEAYGGKQQGMRDTYGDKLRFVAFDVKIGDCWLSVPDAASFVEECGLEFVHYQLVDTDLDLLNKLRDSHSVQAYRNGMGDDKKMEGLVLRPTIEVTKNNGRRIIAKHKRDDFRETKSRRKVDDPTKFKILAEADEVADEWVTEMRLSHVLDKIEDKSIENMRGIIHAMINDVKVEGDGEIEWSKPVEKAIGKKTAVMFKRRLKDSINA